MSASSGPTRQSLQRARRSLLEKYGQRSWFRGVGIVPTDAGLGLRMNIDPGATIEDDVLPRSHHDIAIEIVRTKGYERRED